MKRHSNDCGAATPQPPPKGDGEVVLDMVVADIKARIKDGSISGTEGGVAIAAIHDFEARSEEGSKKYGTRLKTFNGRDALMDAYQEAIDLVMYLRQAIAERAQGNEEQHRCRCHRGSGDPHIS